MMVTTRTATSATLRHGRHLFFFSWLAGRRTLQSSQASDYSAVSCFSVTAHCCNYYCRHCFIRVVFRQHCCTVSYIPCTVVGQRWCLCLVYVCGGSSLPSLNREVITAQGYYYTLLFLSHCVATRLYFTSPHSVALCTSITSASTFDSLLCSSAESLVLSLSPKFSCDILPAQPARLALLSPRFATPAPALTPL